MVPHPSISYAVKKLGEELVVQLFDRCGRKIRLNDYGTYLYQKVSIILNTIDECKIHFFRHRPTGTYYIYSGW